MTIQVTATGLNIALTVLLVGGIGPAPALGVVGAGVGTAIGNLLSGVALVVVLASGRHPSVGFSRHGLRAWPTGRTIVAIGAPQALERSLYALASLPLNALVLTFGPAANAGFNVGRRVLLLGMIPSLGLSIAASSFVGSNVGRHETDAAGGYGQGALALSAMTGVVAAGILTALAQPIAALFAAGEADAAAAIVPWVRTFAAALVFRGLYAVLRGAMQGSGETRYPLYASAVGVGAVMLGGAYLLGVVANLGLPGIYAAVIADPVVRTAMLLRWWWNGSWRRAADPHLSEPVHAA